MERLRLPCGFLPPAGQPAQQNESRQQQYADEKQLWEPPRKGNDGSDGKIGDHPQVADGACGGDGVRRRGFAVGVHDADQHQAGRQHAASLSERSDHSFKPVMPEQLCGKVGIKNDVGDENGGDGHDQRDDVRRHRLEIQRADGRADQIVHREAGNPGHGGAIDIAVQPAPAQNRSRDHAHDQTAGEPRNIAQNRVNPQKRLPQQVSGDGDAAAPAQHEAERVHHIVVGDPHIK